MFYFNIALLSCALLSLLTISVSPSLCLCACSKVTNASFRRMIQASYNLVQLSYCPTIFFLLALFISKALALISLVKRGNWGYLFKGLAQRRNFLFHSIHIPGERMKHLLFKNRLWEFNYLPEWVTFTWKQLQPDTLELKGEWSINKAGMYPLFPIRHLATTYY